MEDRTVCKGTAPYSPMPGVVDVVTGVTVAGRGGGVTVAQPPEAAGWKLVVQSQH